ncbi:hypothetical protein N4G70_09805 [Streptomyces sp. ASQP_92]|uniref:hypothetical protein n=1 Tax=Streptomyces sp. ASQP_92 TaxID=2979116 RepID=UPI0021BFF7F7|nr:hypothetical protein [Streptomyces sp. ASQP_92]MCT9089163.1 hypothetical protein [Streptomyces sp. ASQP_92]
MVSMGDYVGVDPVRVRKLADRLQDLEAALARHGALIRKNFASWQSGLDLSLLAQQTQAVGEDARSMSKRADLARTLEVAGVAPSMCTTSGDIIDIPWDMADVDKESAREAGLDAAALQKALDHPKDKGSREDIAAIGRALADHQDDPTYLNAFAAAGGIVDAARVSRALHTQDGTHGGETLSKDSQNLIGQYATGVNRVFALQSAGRIPPNPDYAKALTNPPDDDMWSVGMLFKYGPKGNEWDTAVLTKVGAAMLDWRTAHQMRPAHTKGQVAGMVYVAPAFVDPDHAWYGSLGLTHDYNREGMDDAAKRALAIDANDPSLALMQRVGENPDASRNLLTGTDGARHAQELVSDHWATPGLQTNDYVWPSTVIRAATGDRQDHFKASAEAAANIINAGAAKFASDGKKSGAEKDQYPVNPEVSKALSYVFQSYVPDFAASTGVSQNDATVNDDGTITVGRAPAKAFLSEIMKNRDEAGYVIQAINAQISRTSQHGIVGDDSTYLKNLAELRGEVSVAGHDVDMNEAALRDAEHAKQLMWFNIISSGAAAVPLPSNPVKLALASKWVQAAIWAGIPYGGSTFPSGEANQVESAYKDIKFGDSTSMQIPLMQGLVRAGDIKPPEAHPEWANGNIVIRNDADRAAFNQWWVRTKSENHGRLDNFDDDMRDSFSRGVG